MENVGLRNRRAEKWKYECRNNKFCEISANESPILQT